MTFGSILAFTCYAYALRHLPASLVRTYAYVNPVVAVLLGYALLQEPITARMLAAMTVVLGAVAWLQLSARSERKAEARRVAEATG